MKLRTLVVAVIAAILPATAGWAACTGEDFLAGLERADPDFAKRLEAEVARAPYTEGRFWRIEKDGRVSHAFGTYHSPASKIAQIPDGLAEVLRDARVLLVEVLPEEQERMQAMMARDPSLFMDMSGAPLSSWLSRRETEALDELLSGYGMTAAAADQMRPWFLNMLLATPPCVLTDIAGGAEILDDLIIAEARSLRVTTRGLERIEEAIEVFQAFPEREQRQLLQLNLLMSDFSEAMMVSSERLYLDEDIWLVWIMNEAIAEAMGVSETLQPMLDLFYERALVERNRNWMPTLLRELGRGDAVIAVGALHLAGPDSLQVMLEREGYTITRLDMAGNPVTPSEKAPKAAEKDDLTAAPDDTDEAPSKKTK